MRKATKRVSAEEARAAARGLRTIADRLERAADDPLLCLEGQLNWDNPSVPSDQHWMLLPGPYDYIELQLLMRLPHNAGRIEDES